MRSSILGIVLLVIVGVVFWTTRQDAADEIAARSAGEAVLSARATGRWQNVSFNQYPQKPKTGVWHFEVTVRDHGMDEIYYLPVHQTCFSVTRECFRVAQPIPVGQVTSF